MERAGSRSRHNSNCSNNNNNSCRSKPSNGNKNYKNDNNNNNSDRFPASNSGASIWLAMTTVFSPMCFHMCRLSSFNLNKPSMLYHTTLKHTNTNKQFNVRH